MSATPEQYAWALSGHPGISSMTIWSVMTGITPTGWGVLGWTPADCGDFGRCSHLLSLFPGWRARLPEVAARHPRWAPLVAHWDELEAMRAKGHPGLTNRIRELNRSTP